MHVIVLRMTNYWTRFCLLIIFQSIKMKHNPNFFIQIKNLTQHFPKSRDFSYNNYIIILTLLYYIIIRIIFGQAYNNKYNKLQN